MLDAIKNLKTSHSGRYGLKIALIFVLLLLFLIPIGMVKGIARDRRTYQKEAIDSIITPLGNRAEINGILVQVPCLVATRELVNDNEKIVKRMDYAYFAPDSYSLEIAVNPHYLARGIFKVPVFAADIMLKASFNEFDFSRLRADGEIEFCKDDAILVLGFANNKTLTAAPELKIAGQNLKFLPEKPHSPPQSFNSTVCYQLSAAVLQSGFSLEGKMSIQGGESICIQPVALQNTVKMQSTWENPSFTGGWLPSTRNIDSNGFSAEWNIAGLDIGFPKYWFATQKTQTENFSASFITPVDVYQEVSRSIKYALLFLIVPFLAIFICEVFSKKRIHPVQYCLIGLADVVFYLLLLSISEQLKFNVAYFISAACVSLTTFFYAKSIFKSWKRGGMLFAVQMVSYFFLYGTLQAADYALLIGSVGLFLVVALLMFITRKIDWYGENPHIPPPN